jgi:hypothetical protein
MQAANDQHDSLPWVIDISLHATRVQQHADIKSSPSSPNNLIDVWDSSKYNRDKFYSHLTANKLHLHCKVQAFNAIYVHGNPNWLLWLRTATLSVSLEQNSILLNIKGNETYFNCLRTPDVIIFWMFRTKARWQMNNRKRGMKRRIYWHHFVHHAAHTKPPWTIHELSPSFNMYNILNYASKL